MSNIHVCFCCSGVILHTLQPITGNILVCRNSYTITRDNSVCGKLRDSKVEGDEVVIVANILPTITIDTMQLVAMSSLVDAL